MSAHPKNTMSKISSKNWQPLLCTALATILIAGCDTNWAVLPPSTEATHTAATPLTPRETTPATESTESLKTGAVNKIEPFIQEGTGFVQKPAKADKSLVTDAQSDGSILNFVNTDVHDVIKSVLGDFLGLNYVIAPNVQGTLSLRINQGLPKDSFFSAFNAALRLNGIALINTGNMIRVVPASEATHQNTPFTGTSKEASLPGFGVEIVTLHNISSEEIQHLLATTVSPGTISAADASRNILLIAGTEEERNAVTDLIRTFDVDWLSGMSFGLFPLKETSANTMAKELRDIFQSNEGLSEKQLRILPLDRLNAIMVVATEPKHLKQVKKWIERLDVDAAPSDKKIWVYSVQNGRATSLAQTLNNLVSDHPSKQTATTRQGGLNQPMPALSFSSGGNTSQAVPPPTLSDMATDTDSGNKVRIIADDTTNSLMIMGTKAEFSTIEAALKKLDIVPLQVRIEAVIAEVTLNDELKYGVQYFFNKDRFHSILTTASTAAVSPALPGFSTYITGSKISSVLDLLQSVTDVHVISSPQLMVLNNQTAVLQVGDEVPVATQSAVNVITTSGSVVNSIEMKDTGVILKVTPRVNASGMVLMDVSQEVSDVVNTTTSNLDSPTIQQRKIASSIAVRDGETIALGGMIKDSNTVTKNGVPLLAEIPYLGSLFRSTDDAKTRTEILAMITPRVVRSDRDVRDATEEMKQKIQAVAPLDQKIR